MKLSEFKKRLLGGESINFTLPDGKQIPSHFHITEVGLITRKFIDCGGTQRETTVINFQIRTADDTEHRLAPQKLLNIINISDQTINLGDQDIEVEYQGDTIEKYGIDHNGKTFVLTSLHTDCLAREKCGIPPSQTQKKSGILSRFSSKKNESCTEKGTCC